MKSQNQERLNVFLFLKESRRRWKIRERKLKRYRRIGSGKPAKQIQNQIPHVRSQRIPTSSVLWHLAKEVQVYRA